MARPAVPGASLDGVKFCIPSCPAVAAIFQALCDGAAANPDEDMEDDEGDFYFDQVRIAVVLTAYQLQLGMPSTL